MPWSYRAGSANSAKPRVADPPGLEQSGESVLDHLEWRSDFAQPAPGVIDRRPVAHEWGRTIWLTSSCSFGPRASSEATGNRREPLLRRVPAAPRRRSGPLYRVR